jgi:cysteine-rich repeat protein
MVRGIARPRGLRPALALALTLPSIPWWTACGDDDGRDPTAATTSSAGSDTAGSSSSEGSTSAPPGTTEAPPPTTSLDGDTEEDSATAGSSTGEIPVGCGDGMLDADEACDDGNDVDADGCNVDCTISGSVLWFHSQASSVDQNDEAFGIAVDAEGRAYVAGEIWNAVDQDFWVRRYVDDGIDWTRTYDGGAGNDGARAVALDSTVLYVAGYRVVAGQSHDMWLRSFTLDGTAVWEVGYADPLGGSNVGQGVAVDPGGHVIVAGNESVGDPLAPQADGWIREYTAAGSPVWTAGYAGAAGSTDSARAVATDAAGRVAVVGSETVAGQGTDLWIRVYDTNGAAQWTATYANPNALDDEAAAVAFDGDGNVIVAGYELDPVIPWRLWLAKYDPAGAQLWALTWDGETLEGARAFGVAVDDTGDIVVTGQHRVVGMNQLLVRKHDPDGNERWVTTIEGGPDTGQVGRAVTIGPNRRVWVAGGVDQGVDGRDVYVARLAP